jgi:hypothetical protein
MSRRSDLLSGLLLAFTGFMKGRLIKRERDAQAKAIERELKAKEAQIAFERNLASQKFGLDQSRFEDEKLNRAEDNRRMNEDLLLRQANEARDAIYETFRNENAPKEFESQQAVREANARQSDASAAASRSQAAWDKVRAAGEMTEEEAIILKDRLERERVASGLSSQSSTPFSNGEIDEARDRLEAYMNLAPEGAKMPKGKGILTPDQPRDFAAYLRNNPVAQDSLMNSQLGGMRSRAGLPMPVGQPQNGTVAPISQPASQPAIGQSSGEPEYKRRADMAVQKYRVALNNPSDKRYANAKMFFANPQKEYEILLGEYRAKYPDSQPDSAYRKVIEDSRRRR